jgi:N-acyl-D-aspartate/D-glutamate deacylase
LIVGSAMDLFHKKPEHQRKMMDSLTDEEINNLIFLPGFSTAEKISDISGRGVGMDVVRRNIQAAREARRLGRRAAGGDRRAAARQSLGTCQRHAARAMNLPNRGSIASGKRADLILVDASLPGRPRVVAVLVAGKVVYITEPRRLQS